MKQISQYVGIYTTDEELYRYASKYWDGKVNAISLSRALRLAMNNDDCPESIDPFESLVDADLYAKPDECGQIWNKDKKIYEDSPEWKAVSGASKKSIPRKN